MNTAYTVKCAKCKVPVESVVENDTKMARCPVCGLSDTDENMHREVGDYLLSQTMKGLDDGLAEASRGNKFLKFTPGPRDNRVYRFVVDYKPGV